MLPAVLTASCWCFYTESGQAGISYDEVSRDISQLLSLAPQEAKACPECQDPRVSQVSQDLRDSQDSPDPQDNMGSQELLAERDPWGCQAPLALEVRVQHPRNVWGPRGC